MFSFTERKKLVELNPYLRRICDLTTPNLATPNLTEGVDGHRAENRYNRTVPTLLSPWRDEQPVLDECLIGLTTDIADRGVGLVFNQPFRADAVLLAYWISTDVMEQPWFFLGSIRRSQSIGGGFWKVGIELQEFANEQYSERLAVLEPMAAKLLTPAEFAIS